MNDPSLHSCKVLIEKKVPEVPEEAKGKPPPKDKNKGGGEEAKPVSGEARFDLIPFLTPGETATEQRIFITTVIERPGTIESAVDGADKSHPDAKSMS